MFFQLFEFYERVSGARMHAAYVRPGGVDRVSDVQRLFVKYDRSLELDKIITED